LAHHYPGSFDVIVLLFHSIIVTPTPPENIPALFFCSRSERSQRFFREGHLLVASQVTCLITAPELFFFCFRTTPIWVRPKLERLFVETSNEPQGLCPADVHYQP